MPESNSMAPKSPAEQGEVSTPDDVATLYSWANLHGAKYREFSASRAQAREETRIRAEEAAAEERRREEEEAERQRQEESQLAARLAAEAAEAARQAEEERLAEIARQAEAERQAVLAAQEAQRLAAQQRSWQPEIRHNTFEPSSFDSPFDAADSQPASALFATRKQADLYPHFSSETPEQPQIQNPEMRNPEMDQPLSAFPPVAKRTPFIPHPQEPAPGNSGPFSGAASGIHRAEHMSAEPLAAFQNRAQPREANPNTGSQASQFPIPQFPPERYSRPQESLMPSPWHPAETRESREPQEAYSRPAWLAPEMSSASQQHPNQASLPRQFGGVPLPSPMPAQTPIPMYSQPVGQAFGQTSVMASDSGSGSPFGQPPEQNPEHSHPGQVDDTLLGSRDRIANRWYALKSVFDPQAAPIEQAQSQPPARVPVMAVFSLAGGVGKTSLIASLGRALSSRGERVLLVDTAAYGLLPFFFGARDQRPGLLRTFNPPGVSADAPIQLVTLDPEGQPPERPADANQDPNQHPLQTPTQDWLAQEVGRYTRNANRVLIDLPTASGSTTRRVLRLAPVVLVPVLPDMNSVVSVGAIEAFFRHNGNGLNTGGKPIMPYYVLNQFDYSLPLHLDVREILREQIGDRLLPFALRRSPAVSEALAEGMTVMDYAPTAVVAEDYANLAGWVRSLNAPATQSYRGVRWSER